MERGFNRRLARLEGLEPPTRGLEIRCSIRLSYRRPVISRLMVSCVAYRAGEDR